MVSGKANIMTIYAFQKWNSGSNGINVPARRQGTTLDSIIAIINIFEGNGPSTLT